MYDADFKYGQNFYMCINEEAKQRLLKEKVPGESNDAGDTFCLTKLPPSVKTCG